MATASPLPFIVQKRVCALVIGWSSKTKLKRNTWTNIFTLCEALISSIFVYSWSVKAKVNIDLFSTILYWPCEKLEFWCFIFSVFHKILRNRIFFLTEFWEKTSELKYISHMVLIIFRTTPLQFGGEYCAFYTTLIYLQFQINNTKPNKHIWMY